ncbi:hypothetical protein J2W34_000084 [Variovorax boronicumulans]|uniref:hypothetical protein n=1 Tax=Variovorax boronicumulans TaxID=436515 RepID=UPI00277E84B2|nr:hypothetical protein [Variovorax boronicumulans]MDQ0068310.1 hypothetical protein [Variovorax boronicumulans]
MSIDIADLRGTIVPRSDQINSEQLLAGPKTITISDVRAGSQEQPVILHYEGDEGRPYKPCLTMRKVLVFTWGEDGRQWIGKSMTLFNDPEVRFGGQTVGGIRISHLSDIEKDVKISLTATKGKKALHTIQRLEVVRLADVIRAINAATNRSGMDAAKALAKQLTAQEDIDAALQAYTARAASLRAKAEPVKQPEPALTPGPDEDDSPPF